MTTLPPNAQLALYLASIDTHPDPIAVRAALALLDENPDEAFDLYSFAISEIYDALYSIETMNRRTAVLASKAYTAAADAGFFSEVAA